VIDFEPDPREQQYWRNFRTGKFWDAHEVLEDLWQESNGTDRTFYQGLIQAAAALHLLGEGNMHGADKLSRTAREKLEPLGKEYRGLQIESLMMGLTVCLEDARRSLDEAGRITDRRPRIPRVDLASGLDPASGSD
jgi:predicted metal-dependent hydrolase